MSAWSELVTGLDRGLLASFGEDVLYQGLDLVPPPATVHAIVEHAQEPEGESPGVYAVLFVHAADLPAAPATGDTWTFGGQTFSCYRVELDQAGGARIGVRR